jgi:hypothetical protein
MNYNTFQPAFCPLALNLIDYLYWVAHKKKLDIAYIKKISNVEFRYRNSVEHHRPQSRTDNIDDKLINCLGNLCLVSKNANSRMNNEEPIGKAKAYYNNGNLPPKRKIMYDMTNDKKSWGEEEIKQHYKDVMDLLKHRKEILEIEQKNEN